jgi:tetratricopeptide (TPR) repeat protein
MMNDIFTLIKTLIELGIIPFILFITIIIVTIKLLIKKKEWGILGALFSLLVFSFFSYPLRLLPFWIVFVFIIALSANENNPRVLFCKNIYVVKITFSLLFAVLTCYHFLNSRYTYQAYKTWEINSRYYYAEQYDKIIDTYEKISPYLMDRIPFIFEYANVLYHREQYENSIEVLSKGIKICCDPMFYNLMGENYQKRKQYEQAEACFMKSSSLVPNRIYPYYLRAKLYFEMGLPDKVKEMAVIVLTKEPKVQSPAIREMREEVKRLQN